MTTNDLVYKIAERAKVLSSISIDALRRVFGTADSLHAVRKETIGMSRGDLIEEVLLDEFIEEHPKEIET
jgi:hypothetical protein